MTYPASSKPSSVMAVSLTLLLVVSFLSPEKNCCQGFALSPPTVSWTSSSATTSSTALFGKARNSKQVKTPKSSNKKAATQVQDPKSSTEGLKLVKLDGINKALKLKLDTLAEKTVVDKLPQGIAPPKVVSSSTLITEEEVLAAHKAWGEGLVAISKAYEERGYEYAKEVAQNVLDAAYGYAKGIPVLFKPTLASGEQTFRLTNEGALSYFVGGNEKYPKDAGFAIMGWRQVKSFPAGILLLGDTALSTGNVHCTNKDGKTTIVDKTWGYQKDDEGNVRITLHHSSLPYSA
jgi:hypothetical protein